MHEIEGPHLMSHLGLDPHAFERRYAHRAGARLSSVRNSRNFVSGWLTPTVKVKAPQLVMSRAVVHPLRPMTVERLFDDKPPSAIDCSTWTDAGSASSRACRLHINRPQHGSAGVAVAGRLSSAIALP